MDIFSGEEKMICQNDYFANPRCRSGSKRRFFRCYFLGGALSVMRFLQSGSKFAVPAVLFCCGRENPYVCDAENRWSQSAWSTARTALPGSICFGRAGLYFCMGDI